MKKTIETKNSNAAKTQAKPRRKKIQYDADYIAYIENGESGAVFITRDIANDINTTGKWIDVVEVEFDKLSEKYEVEYKSPIEAFKNECIDNNYLINDYKYFIVELFDRREQPKYEKHMTLDEKKYLTWQVATRDINMQREEGVTGPQYLVLPKLKKIKIGKGEYRIIKDNSYKSYHKEVRDFFVTQKPEWKYKIIATRELNDNQFKYIINNICNINRKIYINKSAQIVFFNLK